MRKLIGRLLVSVAAAALLVGLAAPALATQVCTPPWPEKFGPPALCIEG